MNRSKRLRRQGFTLMEMLIVLAILVMLMGLALPRFLGARKKADIRTAKTQIGLFKSALEQYALDMKTFPTTEQGLQALITPPTSETGETAATNWDGPYLSMDTIPLDPWGNPYQYRYPPEHTTADFPEIWSLGPDGQDGTEDDICSWTRTDVEGEAGLPGAEQPPAGPMPEPAVPMAPPTAPPGPPPVPGPAPAPAPTPPPGL